MSCYPVPIKEWFVKGKPFGDKIETLKAMLPFYPCATCGKKVTWSRGWVYHSLPWGYGDAYCSNKCAYPKTLEER